MTNLPEDAREIEDRNRQILDAIADMVLVKGPASRILWANKAFRDFYGMTNDQLQGMIDAPFNEPDFTQKYVRDDAYVFEHAEVLNIPEEAVTRHDGAVHLFHTVKSPLLNSEGKVVMTVGVSRDITQDRQIRMHLAITERMATIGTLAAGVAHEINNPLTYVLANLDMAAERLRSFATIATASDRDELSEMIAEAQEGADRVRKIVRGMKAFSRADEDRLQKLDLAPVIETAINMTFTEIRHRAHLVKAFGKLPLVDADEAKLGQVFVNLLVNAAQAIPEGYLDDHEIRVTTSTDQLGWAVIEICDTGMGIAVEHRARIFDPFFTTKAVGVGTGLGLSICQGIVTSLSGEITAESAGDRGTRFIVRIPPSRADQPEAAVAVSTRAPKKGLRRGRILIVDDERALANAMRRALSSEHDVTVASSGKIALELLQKDSGYDVILCDLMMPEVTGMDLYDEVNKASPDVAYKMVFMTGGAFTVRAREFLARVANHRLEKPLDLHNLRALVRDRVG